MTAPASSRPSARDETRFTGAGRLLWDALPAFLVSGTAICVVTGLVLWMAPGLTPFSVVLYALLLAPLYGALVAQAHRALEGETPGAFSLGRELRTSWRLSIGLFAPAAASIALTLVAELVWARTGAIIAAVPAAVGTAVSVLLLVSAVVGLPLGVSMPRLRGIRLALTALVLTARRPVPVIGFIAVIVLVAWGAAQFSGTLLFLLPAPLAVVSVLALRHMVTVIDPRD
ncbi:hypothetical protein HII28_16945 [Planctomonas sp. JC2975]|uniref:hypothetical protein n=1 Tax=Planctomonas sp. JC2975 TaxID=2729626 RepID=UPI001472B070|nr:hypothetical protein [Planctomonas sp. JC2975]NNC13557.1 hypothetical protein [Planctomonas sp. JC2975]